MIKKLIAVLLVLMLAVALLPMSAAAAEYNPSTGPELDNMVAAAVAAAADDSSVINLTAGVTYSITTVLRLELDKNITINGNGAIIDATGVVGNNSSKKSAFTIATGANVTINDLTIVGAPGHGVNVLGRAVAPQTTVTLNNVTIRDVGQASICNSGIVIGNNVTTSGSGQADGWSPQAINTGDNYGGEVSVTITNSHLGEDVTVVLDDATGNAAREGNKIVVNVPENSVINFIEPDLSTAYVTDPDTGSLVFYDTEAVAEGKPIDDGFVAEDIITVDPEVPVLFVAPGNVYEPMATLPSLTDVIANANASYVIVIPALVDFGTIARNSGVQTKAFPVSIEQALLDAGASVNVKVASDFTMSLDVGTADLPYKLFDAASALLATDSTFCDFLVDNLVDVDDDPDKGFNQTITGSISTDPAALTRAGAYSDTMVFTCTYVTD